MKRLIALLCILLLLSGCGMTPSDFHEDISQSVVLSPAPDETDPSDGLTAVIHNLSSAEFAFSYGFCLEIRQADGWYQLPLRTDFSGFPEPAIFLPPSSQYEHLFWTDRAFGTLKPGNYRILWEGSLHNSGSVEKELLLVIDRFEGSFAVCIDDDENVFNLDKAGLASLAEGDCFLAQADGNNFRFVRALPDETARRKAEAASMLAALFLKNNG